VAGGEAFGYGCADRPPAPGWTGSCCCFDRGSGKARARQHRDADPAGRAADDRQDHCATAQPSVWSGADRRGRPDPDLEALAAVADGNGGAHRGAAERRRAAVGQRAAAADTLAGDGCPHAGATRPNPPALATRSAAGTDPHFRDDPAGGSDAGAGADQSDTSAGGKPATAPTSGARTSASGADATTGSNDNPAAIANLASSTAATGHALAGHPYRRQFRAAARDEPRRAQPGCRHAVGSVTADFGSTDDLGPSTIGASTVARSSRGSAIRASGTVDTCGDGTDDSKCHDLTSGSGTGLPGSCTGGEAEAGRDRPAHTAVNAAATGAGDAAADSSTAAGADAAADAGLCASTVCSDTGANAG
jgi:hypothetical protein